MKYFHVLILPGCRTYRKRVSNRVTQNGLGQTEQVLEQSFSHDSAPIILMTFIDGSDTDQCGAQAECKDRCDQEVQNGGITGLEKTRRDGDDGAVESHVVNGPILIELDLEPVLLNRDFVQL